MAETETRFLDKYSGKVSSTCTCYFRPFLHLPEKGSDEKIRKMILNDIEKDDLGVNAQIKDDKAYFSYPIAIMIGERR